MHCPNCGRETNAELKFCRDCGMKLDSVARAVSEHLTVDEPSAPAAEVEKKSTGSTGNRFFNLIYVGLALSFIAVAVGLLGQGVWGAKWTAALLALLGLFCMAIGTLPVAARFDRALLRSMGTGGEPKRRESAPDRPAELAPGDDFEPAAPASTPVPSVTEGTTRDLDKNKTKVLR